MICYLRKQYCIGAKYTRIRPYRKLKIIKRLLKHFEKRSIKLKNALERFMKQLDAWLKNMLWDPFLLETTSHVQITALPGGTVTQREWSRVKTGLSTVLRFNLSTIVQQPNRQETFVKQ
jgi:hypothetical protein